jgi:hypothetical protein
MKNTGLMIATAVLAALAGLLYWSNRHKPSDNLNVSTTPSEPAPKILTLNEADISKIELKKKDTDAVVIERNSGGSWQISKPKTMAADQPAVAAMLSSLSSLVSDRLVDEKPGNLTPYGLSSPAVEVTLTDKNNGTHKLLIGDDTPTGSATYVKLDGDPRVFTIASFTKTGAVKTLDDLRDKRLLTVDADKISKLELTVKNQQIEFGRDKDQWQIIKPKPMRADATKVDELARKLAGATMEVDAAVDNEKVAKAFASGTVIGTVKITTDSGTQQLEVRKEKDDYYGKSSVIEGVYKVPVALGQAMDQKLDDFRDRKLFGFGFNDPAKIEIRDNGKTYTLTKGGDDWWSADGKKYDKAAALAVIDNLRELQATEFADTGFTTTVAEVSVTAGEGKAVEKVLLSKGSKNPVAKRDSETTLYVLGAKSLEDLEKLLSDLKLETAAAK